MTNFIDASKIEVPENRQRKEFDPLALQELMTSIKQKGLLHPIVVRNDNVTLVAGERRLRALKQLIEQNESFTFNGTTPLPGQIPTVCLADLSDLEVREAELEENTIRRDLTFIEKARAISDLAQLREEQAAAEGKSFGFPDLNEEITGRRTGGHSTVRDHLIIAEHLDNPEVAKAPDIKSALKVIRKVKESEARELKIAANLEHKTPHTILSGDFREFFPETVKTSTFDTYIVDPPYGVNADKFGDQSPTEHEYEDDEASALILYKALAQITFNHAKDEAHAFIFTDIRNHYTIALEFQLAGWRVWPKPLIWNKQGGLLPEPDFGPRYTYETILFASKGRKRVQKVIADVLTYPNETDRVHGAQKPRALYKALLEMSCLPGEHVADFTAGSGTILSAADSHQCIATAVEKSPESFKLLQERLHDIEATKCITLL